MTKNEILVRTKRKLFLNLYGEHESVFSGNGVDFKEVREYNTNDDIRHINWKVTAREQTPSVNVFNEEKQISICLVYLNSGSLEFGKEKQKKDTAIEVLTALSFATINNNDTLSTLFYSQKEQNFLKPTKNKNRVDINFELATDLQSLGNEIDHDDMSQYVLNKLKRKSIIFLIGDFLEPLDLKLLSSKHEVYCVIVRDYAEEDLSLLGEYDFVNTQNLQSQKLTIDKATAKKYKQLLIEHDHKLYKHFKQCGIHYEKIYTSDDSIAKLNHLTRA